MSDVKRTATQPLRCSARLAMAALAGAAAVVGLVAVAGAAAPLTAQTPDTDVWLADVSRVNGELRLSGVRNVTARAGYDNQPHFTADGSAILYTRIDESGQADIWRFGIASGAHANVTRTTPESEYSGTPVAGGSFTVIRVERDSTQRLWRFDDDGGNPRVVLADIRPVGYHAWVDETRVAMFVLGQPATLQLGDTRTGAARVIASGIGRAIQKVPGRAAISFLHMLPPPPGAPAAAGWKLKLLDAATGEVSDVATPPFEVDAADAGRAARTADYHAWLPDGTLITAAGSVFYAWSPASGEWRRFAEVDAALNVSRLAVSPDGSRIAFVAERRSR